MVKPAPSKPEEPTVAKTYVEWVEAPEEKSYPEYLNLRLDTPLKVQIKQVARSAKLSPSAWARKTLREAAEKVARKNGNDNGNGTGR